MAGGRGGHTEDPGVVAITNQEAPQLWSSILHTHGPAQHQHTGRHSQTPDHLSLQSLSQAPTIQFLKGKGKQASTSTAEPCIPSAPLPTARPRADP